MSATSSNIVTSQNDFTQEKIDLLKRTICKTATDDEMAHFLHICVSTKLDPFRRQIYFIKTKDGKISILTAIDGYRLIAERTGRYVPGKETVYAYDEKKQLVSATAYVKKLAPDSSWHEIGATAFFKEYQSTGPIWQKMPHVMLAKCAESLALRRAFPADLSGLLTEEEMSQVKLEADEAQKSEEANEQKKFESLESQENNELMPTIKEVLELENFIDNEIAVADPDYKVRLCKGLGIERLSKASATILTRARKNAEKKAADLKSANLSQTA